MADIPGELNKKSIGSGMGRCLSSVGQLSPGLEVALLLPDDLMTGSEKNQVGKALHGNSSAVVDVIRDGIMQRKKRGHLGCSITG